MACERTMKKRLKKPNGSQTNDERTKKEEKTCPSLPFSTWLIFATAATLARPGKNLPKILLSTALVPIHMSKGFLKI